MVVCQGENSPCHLASPRPFSQVRYSRRPSDVGLCGTASVELSGKRFYTRDRDRNNRHEKEKPGATELRAER